MAGLTEFYCGWNEPSHASQFKWLEYTFNWAVSEISLIPDISILTSQVYYRIARLNTLAGRYYNPIPARFLAPIDCSKIPAQSPNCKSHKSCPGIDSQPGGIDRLLGFMGSLNVYKFGLRRLNPDYGERSV
jgi:hypothetical protein